MDRVFGDDWDCNEGVQTVTRCPLANRDQCWPLLVVSPGSSPRWWGSRIPDLSKSALLCLWQFSELLCVENESSAGKSVTSPATDVPFGWTLDASCRKFRTWRGCRGPISEKIVRNITSSSTLAKDISISSATSERRATSRKKKSSWTIVDVALQPGACIAISSIWRKSEGSTFLLLWIGIFTSSKGRHETRLFPRAKLAYLIAIGRVRSNLIRNSGAVPCKKILCFELEMNIQTTNRVAYSSRSFESNCRLESRFNKVQYSTWYWAHRMIAYCQISFPNGIRGRKTNKSNVFVSVEIDFIFSDR